MRWISSSTQPPYQVPMAAMIMVSTSVPERCDQPEGQCDRCAPQQRQHQIAALLVGAGQAEQLSVEDEFGIDVGSCFEGRAQ